jgi:LDH2 family malate/lactate/ureidoglycolate dehydrogenase
MQIKISHAYEMITDILKKADVDQYDSTIIVDHLVDAELCNNKTVGFRSLPGIYRALIEASPKPINIFKETPISALLDGGQRNGMVVAQNAIDIAIKKAKTSGIGICGGFNCSGIGICGYYAKQALPHHLIGIVMANSSAAVAPYGTIGSIFGTNPICFAIRGKPDIIISDAATSKMTYGEILLAQKLGNTIKSGSLINQFGYITTDPNELAKGAILPIAEHKGSALSLAVEILAGPLVCAKAGLEAVKGSWGFLIAALNPEIFVSTEKFEFEVQALINEIRSAHPAPGFSEVLIPGERSARNRVANLQRGSIEIPEEVIQDIHLLL